MELGEKRAHSLCAREPFQVPAFERQAVGLTESDHQFRLWAIEALSRAAQTSPDGKAMLKKAGRMVSYLSGANSASETHLSFLVR